MDKKEFRDSQIKRLVAASEQTKFDSIQLVEKLTATPEWQNAKTIGTTISSPIEVDANLIINAALSTGKKVYVPKTMPKRQMAFMPYTNKTPLFKSNFGILEPEYDPETVNNKLDLLIVPGTGFALDSRYRIGFGGGYYDRFLATFEGKTIALVPTTMQFTTAKWPIDPFDIQIQRLITL